MRNAMRTAPAWGALVWAWLALASPASALVMVPQPLVVDHPGGAQGTLELVEVLGGLPAGGVVSIGAVSPDAQTLVFRGSVDPASPPPGAGLRISVIDSLDVPVAFSAAGFVPGPDEDVQIVGTSGGGASFVFANQAPGSVFDLVFLSFDVPLPADGSLRVEAALENGPAGGSALLVPEPAAAGLLAGGLAALALARRRTLARR